MNRKQHDLILVIIWASVATLLSLMGGGRWFVTLPLVLVFPGYALSAALFPNQAWGWAEQIMLSLGLSMAIVAVGGFILHLLPGGISRSTWAELLGCVTIGAAVVAWVRQWGRARAPDRSADIGILPRVMFVPAVLVALLAFGWAYTSALQHPTPGFTQLWMLPTSQTDHVIFQLGVRNAEGTALSYQLQVNRSGASIQTWSPIVLGPGERWEETLALPAPGPEETIEAVLYRSDRPDSVYRRVVWQRGRLPEGDHVVSRSDGK